MAADITTTIEVEGLSLRYELRGFFVVVCRCLCSRCLLLSYVASDYHNEKANRYRSICSGYEVGGCVANRKLKCVHDADSPRLLEEGCLSDPEIWHECNLFRVVLGFAQSFPNDRAQP